MKKALKYLLLIALLGTLISLLKFMLFTEKPIRVKLVPVATGTVRSTISSTSAGTVKPKATVMVSAEAAGRIEKIHFREGGRIRAGEAVIELDRRELLVEKELAQSRIEVQRAILAQAQLRKEKAKAMLDLETRDLQEEIKRTQASLEVQRSAVQQALLRHKKARDDFKRAESLFKKELIAEEQREAAKTALDLAEEQWSATRTQIKRLEHALEQARLRLKKASVSARSALDLSAQEVNGARAQLALFQHSLEQVKIQIAKTYVRAPFGGIITRMLVEVGDYCSRTPPTRLFELIDDSVLYVEAPIDEVDVPRLRIGNLVEVTLEMYSEKRFQGKLSEISPTVTTDRDLNRTVQIKVTLTSRDPFLKAGMSADVEIIEKVVEETLYLPTPVIQERGGKKFVFIINDGRALERQIQVGLTNWDLSEIRSGLSQGEKVIASLDLKGLKDGARVKITRAGDGSAPK
jgi:HlyD family secretion protein